MGVPRRPSLSDATMVEASVGGSCRCACQEDFGHSPEEEEDDPSSGCCSPQVFTSVLLGVLACVLMTGGVFLAFHRWDPLWLIVSGIGVVLILIGSVLHCCSNSDSASRTRSGRHPGKGGCCGRPVQSDHHHHHLHGHLVANNGSLTEQLLPLSNARSVSQLSLNMLPGYFPPVVTTYGIEQHSAVVQNINRIVQQQQLQQQSPGPNSPGAQSGAGGKSFILLSLPGDTTQANIQNLVATVYQLEGSAATDTPAAETTPTPPPAAAASTSSSPTAASVPTTPVPLLFKSVEVQTCNMWPNMASCSGIAHNVLQNTASASTSTEFGTADPQQPSTSAVTQTENATIVEDINLMDCSADIPQICDNPRSPASGDQTAESPSALTNIPASSVLVDISESAIHNNVCPNQQSTTYPSESAIYSNVRPNPQSTTTYISDSAIQPLQSALVVTIPESADESLLDLAMPPTTDVLVEVEEGTASCSADVSQVSSDVLIDISDSATSSEPSEIVTSMTSSSDTAVSVNLESVENTNSDMQAGVSNVASASNHQVVVGGSELSLSNLSDIDGEVDDSELLERSSPPPSYDDATHEGENAIGAFGLAYGTI